MKKSNANFRIYLRNKLVCLKQRISERPSSGTRAPTKSLIPFRVSTRIPQRSGPIKRCYAVVLHLLLEKNCRSQRLLVNSILISLRRPNPRPPIAPNTRRRHSFRLSLLRRRFIITRKAQAHYFLLITIRWLHTSAVQRAVSILNVLYIFICRCCYAVTGGASLTALCWMRMMSIKAT